MRVVKLLYRSFCHSVEAMLADEDPDAFLMITEKFRRFILCGLFGEESDLVEEILMSIKAVSL